jgi:hypothetical protein
LVALTEDDALVHPQSNLLTGCLGTAQDPPVALGRIDKYLQRERSATAG